MFMKRREFLAAGLALNLTPAGVEAAIARSQQGASGGQRSVEPRSAKTTRLFKSPGLYPNALAVMTDAPGGLWIGQQKVSASSAKTYNLPFDTDPDEAAWRTTWIKRALKTVKRGQDELRYHAALMDAYAQHLSVLEMTLLAAGEEKRTAVTEEKQKQKRSPETQQV